MKRMMPGLKGNRRLASKLGDEIINGTLSHAYIIAGPSGSGKHTLALNIAAAVSCEAKEAEELPLPCRSCLSCEKIFGGISPDVSIIGLGDRASIGVETVRELRLSVLKAPNDTDTRVFIIENADKMTEQAQNALLLTLEEPPEYVLFLLLCESAEDLLETVRSRAPVLRTELLSPEEIEEELLTVREMARLKAEAPDEFRQTVMAAGGRLGQALLLSSSEKRRGVLEARLHADRFVRAMCRPSDGADITEAVLSFPKGRGEVAERLGLARIALRDLCLLKKSEDAPLCFYSDKDSALELSDKFTLSSLMALAEDCEAARLAVLRSANIRLTLLNLAMRGNHGK